VSTDQHEDTSEAVQLQQELPRDVIEVREDTAGTWTYHLGNVNNPSEALCGERVMGTGFTLQQWGNKSNHVPMSYCTECEEIALEKAREGAW